MPYDTSDLKLEQLIRETIHNPQMPEISRNIKRIDWTEATIIEEAKKHASSIWASEKSRIDEYARLESEFKTERERIDKAIRPEPVPPSVSLLAPPHWMHVVSALAIMVLALSFVVLIILRFIYGWDTVSNHLVGYTKLYVSIFAVLALWVVVVTGLKRIADAEHRAKGARYREERDEWLTDKAAKTRPLMETRERLAFLEQDITKTLVEGQIRATLNTLINSRLAPSYITELNISGAKGFAEVFNPEYTIDTSAKESLEFLLNNMPGGSIGIAGPRGSGKSTLLRLFCGPKRSIDSLQGQRLLPVLVSAPVQYQGRDFILYLFSSVCQSLLEMENVQHSRPALASLPGVDEARLSAYSNLFEPLRRYLRPVPGKLFRLGLALIALSLFLSFLTAIYSPKKTGQQQEAGSTQSRPTAATSEQPATQPAAAQPAATQPQQAQAAQPSPATSRTPQQSEPFGVRFISALGIQPATMLMWGVYLIAIAILIAAFIGWRVSIFIIYGIFGGRIGWWLFGRYIERLEESYRKRMYEQEKYEKASAEPELAGLAGEATEWLKQIKFQQSYTSGWSGALKLPVGLDGGLNSAVTLSQNQLSLPEIVHFFLKFLDSISSKYKVIIGIDELDKLETDEKAQRFLNEIKSVFGVDHCFYLISVSENAMSSFERRGLPFRDAFDSSFDSIIYVDYLDFEGAKSLIEQRVIGRPVPFFALSYCLAGGLARDIIRTFRSMLELQEEPPARNDLETLGRAVIHADIKGKLRATVISAKKIELEEVDSLLEKLCEAEENVALEDSLLKATEDLLASRIPPPDQHSQNGDKQMHSKRERINSLMEELATYLYYSVTLLQFFKNSLSEDALTKPAKGGSLDDLAKARQLLAVNPAITRKMLNKFRSAHGLPVPQPLATVTTKTAPNGDTPRAPAVNLK